jgi:1-acyl-sn-glycerol-3-phosphate acyltransferase
MSLIDTLLAASHTLRISVGTLTDSALGRASLSKADERLAWWSRRLLDDAEVDLEVRGTEHIPLDEPLVVMSNHRSYYDIPTMFCTVPGRLRMVAKKELFMVPVFGAAMLTAGFVRVDRGKRESAVESLKSSGEMLKQGTRVWIAPEGTRSRDGSLGAFKSGGFHLALDNRVRILPVAISGTEKVMPSSGFTVHKGARVVSTVLPPIDTMSFGRERRKELTAAVRTAIETSLFG